MDLHLRPLIAHYTYLARCVDGTLYAGYCTDLVRRSQAHNGLVPGGARYTRQRRPVTLVQAWAHDSKGEALRHEILLKALPRSEKLRLVGWPGGHL